jgi:hypothetical protein
LPQIFLLRNKNTRTYYFGRLRLPVSNVQNVNFQYIRAGFFSTGLHSDRSWRAIIYIDYLKTVRPIT